jgi:sigma-B regulation protein RsbU (phosphoserine phosphatase)
MKVLVVDDDPVVLTTLRDALTALGHAVAVAGDGEAGWKALQSDRQMRLVVCDWQLPRLDGLGLCRRIRQRREDYVSFILVTQSDATNDNLDEAYAAGVDAFLTKPVDVSQLRLSLHVAARIMEFTSEIRTLRSFLPICMYCKKVRDDSDYWQQIEGYLHSQTGTTFSHGICQDCEPRVLEE